MAFNNDLFQKYAAAGQAAWDEEHKGLLSVRDEEPEPQQEDAYSRMVREQYGQRQPQKAAQQTDGATLLDNGLTRGFAGGFIGVPASIASFGAGLAGTDGEIGRKLQGLANEYGRREKDYSLQDIVNDPVEYATDLRSGALYGIGSGLGSTAALYGITKAAAPVLAAAAPAGAVSMAAKVAQAAGKVPGLKYFAENTPTAEFLRTNVYRAIPEALGQGGAEYDKLIHNEDGSINPDADRSEARKKMLIDTAINIPLLVGSNALESAIGGKFVKDTTGKGIKDTIREGAKALGIEILQNAGEEGAQTTTDEAVEGQTAYFGIYEGSGTGEGKATSKGWQNNRKTADYVAEIAKHFNDVSRKGNMIIAKEPVIRQGEKATWSMDTNPENDIRYSIREKATAAAEKLTNPEPVRYGNNSTAFGRVTQKISGATKKSAFQKGMDFFHDFYFNMFDEDTHAHELDKTVEKRTGVKPTDSKSFYESVRMAGSLASGHVTGMIAGNRIHGETVQSRLRSTTLQEQFDPDATLQNMMDIIDPEKMNAKYKDFLVKYDLRDWQQALDTYLAAWRLKEMYNLSLEEYGDKHRKWRDKRDKARAAGKEFKEPEPRIYRLPGNLTISDVNATIKAAPPEMEQAAKVYYAFNKNMTVLLADAGLITPKLYHLLNDKYKRYCPLMRDFSDTAAADQFITSLSKGGDSVVNVSYALKEILESGSKRNLLSPLESTIKAAAVICDKAERNKVGQMAVRMAAEHKLNDLIWKVDDKKSADPKNCIFTVMFNGEKVAYQCVQELYEPIVGCPEPYTNMLLNIAAIPATWLRTGATISPTFSIRNAIKDTLFAGVSSKNGFIPIYDTYRGYRALRKNPKMKAQFEAMGVPMYTFFGNEIAAAKQLKDLHIKEPETLVQWLQKIRKNPVTGTKAALEKIAELSEQSTRMGEFQRALENGKSLEDAARAARNVTLDFSRHGRTGKYINRAWPFFNACLQGSDKLYHLIKEEPVRTTTMLALYITLPSVILWTMNHDKYWWRELDPDLKNNNWFLETPEGIVRFPKPQETGVAFGSGIEALLEQASNRDPVAMKNWAWAMFDAVKPNLFPTLILPLLENYVNISFFRSKPIVSKRNEKLPGEMQYTGGTSELSKMIGGSAPVKAVVKDGYSPSKIDNFIRGYTGTMGMLLWQGVGEAANRLRGIEDQSPAKRWTEMPFVREFFVNPYSINRSVNDFYNLAAEAEVQHNGYGKKGKPSAAVVGIRKARTLIANERKEIQKITGNKHFTPERKREMIDQRQERIKTIAEKALEKYRDKL